MSNNGQSTQASTVVADSANAKTLDTQGIGLGQSIQEDSKEKSVTPDISLSVAELTKAKLIENEIDLDQGELIEYVIKHRSYLLERWKFWISVASLLATGSVIYFTGATYLSNDKSSKANIDLSEKRLTIEQFSKAVEQIGDQKTTVVHGGIRSLEKIAENSEDYRWKIVQVLSTFVKENSKSKHRYEDDNIDDPKIMPAREKAIESDSKKRIKLESQAALEVIASQYSIKDGLNEDVREYKSINLSYSILNHADLKNIVRRTGLKGENENKFIIGAYLKYANLKGVFFEYANLEGADLTKADLRYSHLAGSFLDGAILSDTNLLGADLSMVNNIDLTQIKSACFWDRAKYDNSQKIILSQNESGSAKNEQKCREMWRIKKFDTSTNSFLNN